MPLFDAIIIISALLLRIIIYAIIYLRFTLLLILLFIILLRSPPFSPRSDITLPRRKCHHYRHATTLHR